MVSNKTFKTVTTNAKRFNLLTLPGTNFFKFEIINHNGSNIERVIKDKTNKNVFGISHLIEHLGLKSTKDFTTEEILKISKNDGVLNASTNYDTINYWFKTTSANTDLAIKLVCNVAFNDLTKINKKEFDIEKAVVLNEAKRAYDEAQMMFFRNSIGSLAGYEHEDNIIGVPSTIESFSLDDIIAVKNILLTNNQNSYNIIYDNTLMSEDEVLYKVLSELSRHVAPALGSLRVTQQEYLAHLKQPRIGEYEIESNSQQMMTNITIDAVENTLVSGATLDYLESLAEKTSLDDLIRQQNGLTYGTYFFMNTISYTPYASFICDISAGNEERLIELFKKSINLSTDGFNQTKYDDYMKSSKLKRVMQNLNLEAHDVWFYYDNLKASDLDEVRDVSSVNLDYGYDYVESEIITYFKMKESMENIRALVNNDFFGRVKT